MPERYIWKPLSRNEYTDWSPLCNVDEYHFYREDEKDTIFPYFSGAISRQYFDKLKGIMVMCSGKSVSSCTYFVLNCHREDKGNVIDEDPMIIPFNSGQKSTPSGMILFHGNWDGRTRDNLIPSSIVDEIEKDTIKLYYPSASTYIDISPSGSLSSLKGYSDSKAFDKIIAKFRENTK